MNVPRALALVAVLLASPGGGLPAEAGKDASPRPVAPELQAANLAFAIDLYGALAKAPGNLVFSPFSVQTAFAMMREGARRETAAELDRALRLPPAAAPMFRDLLEVLNAPRYSAYELAIANGLFLHRGGAVREEFRRVILGSFGAEPRTLDFAAGKAARDEINAWVAKKTRDRIRDLLPPGLPGPDTRHLLANAVYFRAFWMMPFLESFTKDAEFHAPGGDVKARLMWREDHIAYAETPELQVVELFLRYRDTSMFVVLPRTADGLPALERGLTAESLKAHLAALTSEHVVLKLPKWKHTVAVDLSEPMRSLGAASAFDPKKADFTGIAETPPLVVTSARHQAFIAVDEEGVEAAGATGDSGGSADGPDRKEKKVFTADRPFLYGIRHHATGTILFLGRVLDPTK